MTPFDDDNFEEYAVSNYKNSNCVSLLEFLDDLKTFKYIKRLINKYNEKGDLKSRLILNHIICLSNVFGVEATVSMLMYKIEKTDHDVLNAFLLYLNYVDVNSIDVLDLNLYQTLKKTI
jgi:hypothetical protein